MRMHKSVVDKMVYLCGNYGGHQNESKLIGHINSMRLSAHIMPDGTMTLVDTQTLINERNTRRLDIGDIIPMMFHPTVLKKLMYTYEMYSGHSNELKLRQSFSTLDLTPYERSINGSDVVLVLSSDYIKVLQSVGRKGE